jgi:hypothetical protein
MDPEVRARHAAAMKKAMAWVPPRLVEEHQFLASKLGRSEADVIIRERLALKTPPTTEPVRKAFLPAIILFCNQCDRRVRGAEVEACRSQFCALRKAAA